MLGHLAIGDIRVLWVVFRQVERKKRILGMGKYLLSAHDKDWMKASLGKMFS